MKKQRNHLIGIGIFGLLLFYVYPLLLMLDIISFVPNVYTVFMYIIYPLFTFISGLSYVVRFGFDKKLIIMMIVMMLLCYALFYTLDVYVYFIINLGTLFLGMLIGSLIFNRK